MNIILQSLKLRLITIRRLLRIEQWYKNFLIFVPLLFVEHGELYSYEKLVIGFFGLCAISSVTYIMNDWKDRERDQMHPVKKLRPLASGQTSGTQAVLAEIVLFSISGMAIWQLGFHYGIFLAVYFVITTLYTLGLKNIPIIDILIITGNFILRMMAGFKTWPTADTKLYFILLFGIVLVFLTHKRRSDIKFMEEDMVKHKPVLQYYNLSLSYFLRAAGYVVIIICLFLLWRQGYSAVKSILGLLLLVMTSVIFVWKPKLAMKPHYILKIWWWDIAALVNIVYWNLVIVCPEYSGLYPCFLKFINYLLQK